MIFHYDVFVYGTDIQFKKFKNCIVVDCKRYDDEKMAERIIKQITIDYNFDIEYQ